MHQTTELEIAHRPTIHSNDVTSAVARKLLGELTCVGGYTIETAQKHVQQLLTDHCLEDGYHLTKRLEYSFGWVNCDMRIARVLDNSYEMLLSEVRLQTQLWVMRNDIQPKKMVGDEVTFQYSGERIKGTISFVSRAFAQYVVSVPLIDANARGLTVDFEVIHMEAENELTTGVSLPNQREGSFFIGQDRAASAGVPIIQDGGHTPG